MKKCEKNSVNINKKAINQVDNLYLLGIIRCMSLVNGIDFESEIPVYKQLSTVIEQMIFSGKYKAGDKLLSENEICKKYNVSRTTVRQTLNLLNQKGLINSVHGKGTFVKIPEIRHDLSRIVRFGTALNREGLEGFTRVSAFDTEVKKNTALEELGDDYFNLFLLGYIQDTPVVYYKSYIVGDLKNEIYASAKRLEMSKKPFSTLDIYDDIGIKIKSIKQEVSAVVSGGKTAEIMELNGAYALLRLESVYYDSNNRPIEYKTAYYRSDVYRFNLIREIED